MQRVLSQFPPPRITRRNALFSPKVGQRWIFRSDSGYFGRERFTDYSVLLISAAFVLMGLAILINAGLEFVEFKFPAKWPTTQGLIVSVEIVKRNYRAQTWWFPLISYQYSVQGRTVVNTRVAFGPEIYWRDRSEANRFLERYITRSHVLVYYNPDSVTEAVIEPSWVSLEPATWVGVVMILAGLGVLVIYDRLG